MPPIANDPVMNVFARLDLKTIALLLDVDGTIIDIGPSPTEVHVSDTLLRSLKRLFDLTDGAVALVSGRPIADLDRMFSPLRLPAVGGHGAEMRLDDNKVFYWAKPLSEELRKSLADPAVLSSGVLVEDKKYSLVLHFRGAPKEEERLSRHVMACRAAFSGESTELLVGKAMVEVLRPGVNKGESIRKLMAHAPFNGRMPVFIGDDVTDESVFRILPEIGGKGFSVNRHFPGLTGIFRNPAHVRDALNTLAANGQTAA